MEQKLLPECVPALWASYRDAVADMRRLKQSRDSYSGVVDAADEEWKKARKLLPEYKNAKAASKQRKKAAKAWEQQQTPGIAYELCIAIDAVKQTKELLKTEAEQMAEFKELEDKRQEYEKLDGELSAAREAAQAFAMKLADAE